MSMIYLDASDKVLGRMASQVAKRLLGGESVFVVNSEKAVVLGNETATIRLQQQKIKRGDPYHGPFYPRKPDMIFKRVVRGMLPYKTPRGRDALKRLRVFVSVPDELKDKQFIEIKGIGNKGECKCMTLQKLAERS
jgi:large subunit ribosomal protein L13